MRKLALFAALTATLAIGSAGVEDLPGHPRPDAPVAAGRQEKVARFNGFQADGADEPELRVEIGHGLTDPGALGGQLPLGPSDVRPPPQGLGGYAHRHGGRDYVLDLLTSHEAVSLTYDECAGVTYDEAVYAGTKHAQVGLMRSVAKEVAPRAEWGTASALEKLRPDGAVSVTFRSPR